MLLSHGEGPNWKTFHKDMYQLKILIESVTILKVTYKDRDYMDGLFIV